jgi:hypothetical protein
MTLRLTASAASLLFAACAAPTGVTTSFVLRSKRRVARGFTAVTPAISATPSA